MIAVITQKPISLPPLVTIFTSSASCATRWIQGNFANEIYSGIDVSIVYSGHVASSYYSECNPYGVAPSYSPGVCGNAQTLAEIRKYDGSSDFVWAGICCNSDMTYASVNAYCTKTYSTRTTALARFNTTLIDSVGQSSAFSLVDTDTIWCSPTKCDRLFLKSETVLTSGTAWAAPTYVYWQSGDLSLFPSDYAFSIAAVMSVPFGNSTTSSSLTSTTLSSSTLSSIALPPVPPVTSQGPSSRLSPGITAGIAVAAGVFTILGVVFLLYLLRRRRQQQQQQQQQQQHSRQKQKPQQLAQAEIPEMEGCSRGLMRFVNGQWRAETHGTSVPVEAGSLALVEAGRTSVRVVLGSPVELDGRYTVEGRFLNPEEGVPF